MLQWVAAGIILLIAFYTYGVLAQKVVFDSRTWLDEVNYLIKSWWYVTGRVTPYSDQDPTWYMPLYFYELGWWQQVFGQGHLPGRLLSVLFGGLNGLLLFIICRKLTANVVVAALAVLMLLSTPATVFYFSTANPIASVSFLHLACIWLILTNTKQPNLLTSIALGAMFSTLYFFRQNMVLSIIVLYPVYIIMLRDQRFKHFFCVAITGLACCFGIMLTHSARIMDYVIRLPILSEILGKLDLLPASLATAISGTTTPYSLGFEPTQVRIEDVLNAFVLPYGGTILFTIVLLCIALRGDRYLWTLPTYFFFLAVSHYLGSVGYCATCTLAYTNYYISIGVVAASILLNILWQRGGNSLAVSLTLTVCSALLIVGINSFASGLATVHEYRSYPEPMLRQDRRLSQLEDINKFSVFVRQNTDPEKPVLIMHSLSGLPYAVFKADRMFPVQNINPLQSYRQLKKGLSKTQEKAVIEALYKEGLWTDDLLEHWALNTYDTVIFQEGLKTEVGSVPEILSEHFDLTESSSYRGWNIRLFKRKQPN